MWPTINEFAENCDEKGLSYESTIIWGDFNARVGNDGVLWEDVIGRNGDADVNVNGRLLLRIGTEACSPRGEKVQNY